MSTIVHWYLLSDLLGPLPIWQLPPLAHSLSWQTEFWHMSPLYPGGHSHTGVESCTWLLLRVHFPITHKGHQLPLDPLNACGNYKYIHVNVQLCFLTFILAVVCTWRGHFDSTLFSCWQKKYFFQFSKLKPFNQSSIFVLSHDSIWICMEKALRIWSMHVAEIDLDGLTCISWGTLARFVTGMVVVESTCSSILTIACIVT